MTRNIVQHAAAFLLLMAPGLHLSDEQPDVRAIVTDRAEAHGVSPAWLLRTAECESHLNPLAIGSQGEQGLMQLHPQGLLGTFYRMGYTDAFDAWQASDFAAWAFSAGLSRHWACA